MIHHLVGRQLLGNDDGQLWIIGVILCTLAAISNALAMICMKKAKDFSGFKSYLVWFGGIAFMVFTALMDFVALGFAAQSLIASVGAFSLVCNAILSPCILRETVTYIDFVCAFVVICGCALAIAFGNHEDKEYSLNDLVNMFDQPAVYAYFGVTFFLIAVLYTFVTIVEREAKTNITDAMMEAAANCLDCGTVSQEQKTRVVIDKGITEVGATPLSTHRSEYADSEAGDHPNPEEKSKAELEKEQADQEKMEAAVLIMAMKKEYHMMHCVAYGYMGGILGAVSVMFGKLVAECVKLGGEGFTSWELYVFLMTMAFTLFFRLKFLNTGLRFHDVMIMLPIDMTTWILGGVFGGATYFSEFVNFDALHFAMFSLGTAMGIGGIGVLTYFRVKAKRVTFDDAQAHVAGSAVSSNGVEMRINPGFHVDLADEEHVGHMDEGFGDGEDPQADHESTAVGHTDTDLKEEIGDPEDQGMV